MIYLKTSLYVRLISASELTCRQTNFSDHIGQKSGPFQDQQPISGLLVYRPDFFIFQDFAGPMGTLCSARSADTSTLLQTVHSNILVLLGFIRRVAVNKTSMFLAVARIDETFVTH